MMIDVSSIIHDPDFERDITIERTSGGHFVESDYQSVKQTITVKGVLINSKGKEIEQTEEGDRATDSIDIYVDGDTPIYVTREILTLENNISDVIIDTDGTRYRITNVFDQSQWGLIKAEGQREGAA